MNIKKVVSQANSSIPAYVSVYNGLYADITNGVFSYGSVLPDDTELMKCYGATQDSLLKALTVLFEDGMVERADGKGMVVSYHERKKLPNKISNPMIECAKSEITKIVVTYNYGPATEAALDKMDLRYNEIVLAGNIIYHTDSKPVGHAFIQIPVKCVSEMDVNLNDEQEVNYFLNKEIFNQAASVRLAVRNIPPDSVVTQFLPVQVNTPITFIEEILFNRRNEAIARCKFYFIQEEYDIIIDTRNSAVHNP